MLLFEACRPEKKQTQHDCGRPGELKVTLAREGISGQLPPTVGFTTWWPRTSHAA